MIIFREGSALHILFGEHHRHKTLFCIAYGIHLAVEHVAPESAGPLYFVLEILHTMAG